MKSCSTTILAGVAALAAAGALAKDPDAAAALETRLEGVAPAEVLHGATLIEVTAEGEILTLREGTNGWTCLYPGTDPMCADAGGVAWMKAWMSHGDAPQELGFIYMLLGDEGASNTDPYASGETADNDWVVTGPHVMLTGGAAQPMFDRYTHDPAPDRPYVMWAGTPYAHVMMPME